MKITVNKEDICTKDGISLIQLLEQLGYGKMAAVWINGTQVMYKDFGSQNINEGDSIKIHRITAGG